MDDLVISVGLAGDGDEISAIEDVERAFNIKFDYDDAPNWVTAGDVFASLKTELSAEKVADNGLWVRFAFALSQETGVDPMSLKPESPLLLEGHSWNRFYDALSWLWIAVFALVVLMGLAAFATA